MVQGVVKWFNSEKGYGFLTVDGGGPDVFVHFSGIEMAGYRDLEEGAPVEFEINQGVRGPLAERVRLATELPPGRVPQRSVRSAEVAPRPAQSAERPPVTVAAPRTVGAGTADVPTGGGPSTVGGPLTAADPRAVGPYPLLRRLGEGSMGIVYLARDRSGRQVAVKVVREQFARDPIFLRRFRTEAAHARRVDASSTASVLDAAVDADRPYLVTEFIDGPTLADWVRDRGPLSAPDARAVGVGIAVALIAIHAAGIIHRDLKPSNVMLSYHGPRVIDFGIARSAAEAAASSTNTGYPLGTPAYMSPEQLESQELSFASDVFSWGGVMTYATTGREPFAGEGPFATMFSIVSKPPVLDGVPGELRGLIADALRKQPDLRPTARDLLTQLTPGAT